MEKFVLVVEGPGWETFENVELPRLPEIGDAIETQYGTLPVIETTATPEGEHDGKIVCRMP